jgi:hypothetical protein
VNAGVVENEFRNGLKKLLCAIEREISPVVADPYASSGDQVVHEHDTRALFFDELLGLLGWQRGAGGDVTEEARLNVDHVKFLDYVGVNPDTRAPVLILEAKAWGKPFIRSAPSKPRSDERQLIVEAIRHLRGGGAKRGAPVIGEWHDYLAQVMTYVKGYKENFEHDVPCAVLASGQWLIVFQTPVATFVNGEVNDGQFSIFKADRYVEQANEIYALLNRPTLAAVTPARIRPAQIKDYVTAATVAAAFHGVIVYYQSEGTSVFDPAPRTLIYPTLLVQRDDGTIFTVMADAAKFALDVETNQETGEVNLTKHLDAVHAKAAELLAATSHELAMEIPIFGLSDFPGFRRSGGNAEKADRLIGRELKLVVRQLQSLPNEWLLATGDSSHYLMAAPSIICRFHAWRQCEGVGHQIGQSAIGTARTDHPRSFFVDEQAYHCAHQVVADRRRQRCHIEAIDARTCCRACVFEPLCWTPTELAGLPCGG